MLTGIRDRAADLLLGFRLAVANRRGWGRLVLAVAGIGVAVLVLLFAASTRHAWDAHEDRQTARLASTGGPAPSGVDPLYLREAIDAYHGHGITVVYLRAGGPRAPLPPGVRRLPGPGEAVLSPAAAALLSTPDGELLRQRYPQRVIGSIGREGLSGPLEQRIYLGSADLRTEPTYRFGLDVDRSPLPPLLWALLVVGVVVLLFPVFVFVATNARLGDAERDRRLSTIRLLGASAGQVRWVAAGEALISASLGLLLGAGLFVAARPLVERQTVASITPFAADVVPPWPFVVLIGVAVPVLAVGSALFALRRTVIEPLGVVRQAGPARRRLWWRPLPAIAGAGLLLQLVRADGSRTADRPVTLFSAGVVLVLLGVPTMLPWLLQRALRRPQDRTLALQLATRRLRLDTGTPARVVGGLGVVLAGAIGLSSLLTAAESRYTEPPRRPGQAGVTLDPAAAGAVAGRLDRTLRGLPGVRSTRQLRRLPILVGGDSALVTTALIGDCAALRTRVQLTSCVDGQVFVPDGFPEYGLGPGRRIEFATESGERRPWTVPPGARVVAPADSARLSAPLLLTPAAVPPAAAGLLPITTLEVDFDPANPDAVERIRTAAAPLGWAAEVTTSGAIPAAEREGVASLRTIRRGLLAGALLTLTLAGATLLVSAVDQVRQRRRPLAALAATGVPRALLARSLLWQNAIPVLFAVLVADLTGVLLGVLLGVVLDPVVPDPVRIDWAGVAAFSAAAVLVVAAVTALTLPSVRRATRPTALRAE